MINVYMAQKITENIDLLFPEKLSYASTFKYLIFGEKKLLLINHIYRLILLLVLAIILS